MSKVADLDRELFNCIEEGLKSLSVDKSQNQIQARQVPMRRQEIQCCRTAPVCSDWSENSGLDELKFGGKRKIRR